MLLSDADIAPLKLWLVKKLEAISEADSQILSDYVVAILQTESSEEELQVNAIENLTDFLGDSTKRFVEEVFGAIRSKNYIPGRVPSQPQLDRRNEHDHKIIDLNASGNLLSTRSGTGSRKRNYEDFRKTYIDWDAPNSSTEHSGKQYRQSVTFGKADPEIRGNHGQFNAGHIRDGADRRSSTNFISGTGPRGKMGAHRDSYPMYDMNDLAGIPQNLGPAVEMPDNAAQAFDPNQALQAILTLQAMGFPMPIPGDLSVSNPLPVLPHGGVKKSKTPCRDYETKGVCFRGSSCRFQHKGHNIQDHGRGPNLAGGDLIQSRATNSNSSLIGPEHSRKHRKQADAGKGRAAFSIPYTVGRNQESTGIVVENLPRIYLDQEVIHSFFSSFGLIDNIVVDVDANLAIVEFEVHASARAAIESPKAVFDNRFIKVFWYLPDHENTVTKSVAKESLGISQDFAFDREQFDKDAEAAQKKYEARKTLLEQTEKKRQELVTKQREIESMKVTELQKMQDILATKGKPLPSDMQQVLDAAIIAGGEKTEQLLAQLRALEDEAKSLGLDEEPWFNGGNSYSSRGSYHRGWRGYPKRARGRGHARGTLPRNGIYNLDNRPKQVLVDDVDFDTSKEESLTQFLSTIGDFESVESCTDQKSKIVTFRDRCTAEAFYYGPTDIPGVGKIKLSWVTKPATPSVLPRNDGREMLEQHDRQSDRQAVSDTKNGSEPPEDRLQREDDVDYGSEDYEWIV